MKKKAFAKNSDEFDRRFDAGEDIHDVVDMSQATISRPERKIRLTLDVSESLVKDLDEIRNKEGSKRYLEAFPGVGFCPPVGNVEGYIVKIVNAD